MGDQEPRTRTARGQFYSLRCASELCAARGRPRLTGTRVAHIFVRGVRGRGLTDQRQRRGKRCLRLTAPISERRATVHTSFSPVRRTRDAAPVTAVCFRPTINYNTPTRGSFFPSFPLSFIVSFLLLRITCGISQVANGLYPFLDCTHIAVYYRLSADYTVIFTVM